MPMRPMPPCRAPGCSGRSVGHGLCRRHEDERRRGADAARPSAHARGYGAAWRELRARFLRAHPRCAACGEPATDVDHVVARVRGGADEWANLQALCHACHSRKTNAMDGGGWRGAIGRGG